jgi:hypothetical protein
MSRDQQHVAENASVQITPAEPTATGDNTPTGVASTAAALNQQPQAPGGADATRSQTPPEEPAPVSLIKPSLLQKIGGLFGALVLVSLVACTPTLQPASAPTLEATSISDDASIQSTDRPDWIPSNVSFIHLPGAAEEPTKYRVKIDVAKCYGEVAVCTAGQAYEVRTAEHNLLMTAGATALWNGLSTSGLATPFNTTNAQLAVGDATTSESASQTDLQAAGGTTITTSGLSAATNASPIVITNGSGSWTSTPAVGSVVQVASVNGNTAANGTFEVSAATSTTLTLLNSSGNGAFTTSSSATVKPINYYRQQANASGSAVITNNQIVYVATFGTSNANFHWQEWALTTGAAATNKQAQAPPTMFNRKVVDLGTKTSSASWTLTVTLSLS